MHITWIAAVLLVTSALGIGVHADSCLADPLEDGSVVPLIDPSYCVGAPNTGDPSLIPLTGEFKLSGTFSQATALANMTNAPLTVFIGGTSINVDPNFLAFSSCQATVRWDTFLSLREGTNGGNLTDASFTTSVRCTEPAEWPDNEPWPPTSPVSVSYKVALSNSNCDGPPVAGSFTPKAVQYSSYQPALQLFDAPTTTYCGTSNEVTVVFPYTSTHMSTLLSTTIATPYYDGGVSAETDNVTCPIVVQDDAAKTVTVTCKAANGSSLPTSPALKRITLFVSGPTDGVCKSVIYITPDPANALLVAASTLLGATLVPNDAANAALVCASDTLTAQFKITTTGPGTAYLYLVAHADADADCTANPVIVAAGESNKLITITCTTRTGEPFITGPRIVTVSVRSGSATGCTVASADGTVTVRPAARSQLLAPDAVSLCNLGGTPSVTVKFRAAGFRVANMALQASSSAAGVTCIPSPGSFTGPVVDSEVNVTCTKPGGLPNGTFPVSLSANYSGEAPCAATGSAGPVQTTVTLAAPAAPVMTLQAVNPTPVCPGNSTLSATFKYTASSMLAPPVFSASLNGVPCSVPTAAAPGSLAGDQVNAPVVVSCPAPTAQGFQAGSYSIVLSVATGGPGLCSALASDSSTATANVTCLPGCGSCSGGGGSATFNIVCPTVPAKVAVGDTLDLTFPVGVIGTATLNAVIVNSTLASGLEFNSARVDGDATKCSFNSVTRLVVCSAGSVSASANKSITISVTATTAGTAWQALTASGSVQGSGAVVVHPVQNCTFLVEAAADPGTPGLKVSLTPPSPAVRLEKSEFVFEVAVENVAGPGTPAVAKGVVFAYKLPAGLTVVGASIKAPAAACPISGNEVVCSLGDLAPGATKNLSVTVKADFIKQNSNSIKITSTVNVTCTNSPTCAAQGSALVTVKKEARDVLITNVVSDAEATGDQKVTFTMTIDRKNRPVIGVKLVTVIPKGLKRPLLTRPPRGDGSCQIRQNPSTSLMELKCNLTRLDSKVVIGLQVTTADAGSYKVEAKATFGPKRNQRVRTAVASVIVTAPQLGACCDGKGTCRNAVPKASCAGGRWRTDATCGSDGFCMGACCSAPCKRTSKAGCAASLKWTLGALCSDAGVC